MIKKVLDWCRFMRVDSDEFRFGQRKNEAARSCGGLCIITAVCALSCATRGDEAASVGRESLGQESTATVGWWEGEQGREALEAFFGFLIEDNGHVGEYLSRADERAVYIFLGLRIEGRLFDPPGSVMAGFGADTRVLPQSYADAPEAFRGRHKTEPGDAVLYLVEPLNSPQPGAYYANGYILSKPTSAACIKYRAEKTDGSWVIVVVDLLWES